MAQQNGTGNKSASRRLRKKILVADDDPGIQDIFSIIFENAGYSFEVKKDGDDLLKNKFVVPDLFLIDKQLSGYNGLDICRYLKRQKRTKDIPVIMVSASPDIATLAKEAGADAYIEKPFELRLFLDVVDRYVHRNITKRSGRNEKAATRVP